MLVEQAIFTSVRSGRNEGYQLAACSPGISASEQRELAQWGPSHDSLYEGLVPAESVNFHRLASGVLCVSQTVLAGREYSGRGGQRVYTHMLLLTPDALARFGHSPFRVIESLVVSGRLAPRDNAAAPLEPLTLVGRSTRVNRANLQHVTEKLGPHKLASLVSAALRTRLLGVAAHVSGKRLLTALLDLLPPPHRLSFSLTTGLKVSAARNYRLMVLPDDPEEHRRAIRQVRLEVIDLTKDPPARFAPGRGWPQLIHQLIQSQDFESLGRVLDAAADTPEADLDLIGEQLRERLENEAEGAALTALPA